MSILTRPEPVSTRVLFSAVSSLDRAVIALRRCLQSLGYNPTITREVCEIAFRTRTLADAVDAGMIDHEDVDAAYEAFANGFDSVDLSSRAWDRVPGVWVTARDITPAFDPESLVRPNVDPVDSLDFARMDGRRDIRSKPDVSDLASFRFWQEWSAEVYVEPYRFESECDELRTTRR